MPKSLRVVWLAGLIAGACAAQTLDNGSLNGKFYFVHLLVDSSGGQATNARNLSGAMMFDGSGSYSFLGKSGSGAGPQTAASGNGTYSVAASGTVTLTNPIRSALEITARLSADGKVLLGASTEAPDSANDIFVAIQAPTANLTNAALSGAYAGASVEFPDGQSSAMKTALIALRASGTGQFSQVGVTGHAVDQGSTNVSQSASGSTYMINPDGTGTAAFGTAASLFSGPREIFVSADGNYILGDSTASGGRDLFIATRNFSTSAANSGLAGRYWIAELTMGNQTTASCSSFDFAGASGAIQAFGNGQAVLAERVHAGSRPVDFVGIAAYSVNPDSTGVLAPYLEGLTNMALGVPAVGKVPHANTIVGAQVGAVNTITCQYGVFFAVRAQDFAPATDAPFINPVGVVNAASFAPFPYPTAPGAITALFGANLAVTAVAASALPLPATLGDVSVTVNGTPAPLYFVSPGQINFQTPFEASGFTANIQVIRGGVPSNQVTVPLARTSPAIFQFTDGGDPNRAIVQHLDYTLVSAAKDPATGRGGPAAPGETIIIYLNGLGALQPAVPSGAANPGLPPSNVTDPQVAVYIGGEIATSVFFTGGAPDYAGVYQMNVRIPPTVIGGPNVPLEVVTSTGDSDIVDIPIGN